MPRRAKKLVGYVVYEGMSLLELDASYGFLRGIAMGPWALTTVGASRDPVPTDTPLAVVPQRTFADVDALSGLVLPGASGTAPLRALADGGLIAFVRAAAAGAEWCVSFGTGSLLLAAAELLEGRRATTHWAYDDFLAALGAVPRSERIVEDGRFLTAAGGSGAIDATLCMLDRIAGRGRAKLVQLFGEYDPAPPFGGVEPAARDRGYLAAALAAEAGPLSKVLAAYPRLAEVARALGEPAPQADVQVMA